MKSKSDKKITNNVLVDHHKGKLMFTGKVKPLSGQKGVECTIASRERLRVFFGKECDTSKDLKEINGRQAEMILKPVKNILREQPLDYASLWAECISALEKLSYDPITEIIKNNSFIKIKLAKNVDKKSIRFYNELSIEMQSKIAFFTMLDKLDLQFGFKSLNWSVKDGFEGLQQALLDHGQIIFQGKYGKCFHGEQNTIPLERESTKDRRVYFFKKATLKPSFWTHCVVVDQAKLVEGVPCVFFRDPYDAAAEDAPEKVYMLSYKSFVERISDKYGNADASEEAVYGLVNPETRGRAIVL